MNTQDRIDRVVGRMFTFDEAWTGRRPRPGRTTPLENRDHERYMDNLEAEYKYIQNKYKKSK